MNTYKELAHLSSQLHDALRAGERVYRLDDDLVYEVKLWAQSRRVKNRVSGIVGWKDEIGIEASLFSVKRDVHVSLDDDGISSQALMRIVEIKSMLEKWPAGELAELPPSTGSIPEPEFIVGGRRRRQYRVDEE